MKTSQLVLFLSIVLTIYALLNGYLYHHFAQVCLTGTSARRILLPVFWLLVASYPLGRILERFGNSPVINILTVLGSFWIGIMIYLVLFFLVTDIVNWGDRLFNFLPSQWKVQNPSVRLWSAIAISSISFLIGIGGYLAAQCPRIRELHLTIDKHVPNLNHLHIVAASDIHLGTLVGARQLQKLVRMVNDLNPDLVLFVGDLLDEDMHPEHCYHICNCLAQLQPRLGVFAVPGNHEYYVGLKRAQEYLAQYKVRMLTDEKVILDDKIVLIGRHDAEKTRFLGEPRMTLAQLLNGSEQSHPTIVLDHQPVNLMESVTNGIDLQLSGHTHHGQLWPFNHLTRKVYLISHGYRQIEKTHFYVSNGFGTWGPPMRTSARPEIISIHIQFRD